MLGGVCAGLGEYFGLDVVLVRILFVVLAVFGGSGVVLYLIAWILIPPEPEAPATPGGRPGSTPAGPSAPPGSEPSGGGTSTRMIVGAILLVVGVVMLSSQAIPPLRQYLGPLVLVAIGLAMLLGWRR